MNTEERMLRLSIALTILMAVFGVFFGVLSGSFSIVFDGFYSLVDAAMSGLALVVTTLISRHTRGGDYSRRLAERFNMGFWHLEPMVLAVNGALLCAVALYAMFNAVLSIIGGGEQLEFGYAIIYATIASAICFAAAYVVHKSNIAVASEFLALDAKAWMMSGSISMALLLAFVIGAVIQDTSMAWLTPYVDPAVLLLICLFVLPVPILTVRRAFRDILMQTPPQLQDHVCSIADNFVKEQGFIAFEAYIAKVGRARQIEIYFIVPPDWPAQTLSHWDALRDVIGDAIGEEGPDRWLTIAFTTDPGWAR